MTLTLIRIGGALSMASYMYCHGIIMHLLFVSMLTTILVSPIESCQLFDTYFYLLNCTCRNKTVSKCEVINAPQKNKTKSIFTNLNPTYFSQYLAIVFAAGS